MRLPIEYWKNTLSKLGVRVERRRVKRPSANSRFSFETLERRQVMSGDSPQIAGFLASPAIVSLGSQITLTATGVTDPNGDAISQVRFYFDANNDGFLTEADGSPLGIDTNGGDGWSIPVSTAGLPGGTQRFFAVATDATDLDSEPVAAAATLLIQPKIIDNGGTGFSLVSSNYWSTSSGGYGGNHQFEFGATNGYAQWTFGDLPDGEYRVSATWPEGTNRGTNVPYTVFDGSLDVGTTRVNQRMAPAANVVAGGRNFEHLGSFSVVNGSLVVRMANSSGDGRAIADAVRIQHIGSAQETSDIRVFDGTTELTDGVSTVNLGTTFYGTPTTPKTLSVKNVGLTELVLDELTQADMPAGVILVASYGSTTLARGESTTFQIALAAPSPGPLSGILSLPSNDPDEPAFAITLTGVVNASKIIDNGGAGFTLVSTNYWSTSGGGYGGNHQFEFGATNGYAEWTFENLPAGEYLVSATWFEGTNRGTNVPYTIFDGSLDVGEVRVNQRIIPDPDVIAGSKNFEHLGAFSIINGSLVVRMTNSSGDGRAIADAVRIEHLGAVQLTPDIRVFADGTTELIDGVSAVNLGTAFFGTPTAAKTFTVTNSGLGDLLLAPLTQANMPAGVTLVSSYGATTLARGESTTFQIQLSAMSVGSLNGTLSLPSNDQDEIAFAITLTGAVNASTVIDNGQNGFALVSTNYWSTSGGGFGGGHQFEFGATGGYAEWTFANLPAGEYRVSATWLEAANRGTNVPFTLYDGGVEAGTTHVNQRVAPAANVFTGGKNFELLGEFAIVGGSLVVRMTNSSGDGRAIADAICLQYLGPIVPPPFPATVAATFVNGRLDIFGTPADDIVSVTTFDDGGVRYVQVNGKPVGNGVRAADVTTLVAYLGDGNDTIDLSTLDLTEFSGLSDRSVTVYAGAGDDTIIGTPLGDLLYGDDGNDLIIGGAGDDELYGGNGDDVVFGGDGNDLVTGAAGNDHLYGDAGDDIIRGGLGDDFLYGGDGNDQLLGRDGSDYLAGGAGDDWYIFEGLDHFGTDTIEEVPGEGVDVVDVRNLTLFSPVSLDWTAVQILTNEQSLRFMNANTVETVLGNLTSAYGTRIIDDGSPGVVFVSSQSWASFTGGYQGDYRYEFGAAGGYAEWAFPSLPAGQYRVSATWVEGANRGTNVPYTVFDGSLEVGAISVNQRVSPAADAVADATNFQDLGMFSVVNGSLVVRMTNSSGDGLAIADAIRIEYVGPVPVDPIVVTTSFANGRLEIVGTAGNDIVTVGTLDENGVLYVLVNGQMVGDGVRAADVTTLVADLRAGDDRMDLSTLDLFAFSGLTDGSVTIYGGPGHDRIDGTPLGDNLHGNDGNDIIRGHAGDDYITGGGGNDRLHGGDGADTILGGSGDDLIFGGNGPDHLEGGEGRDELYGEDGDDTLRGDGGDDFLFGGSGNDKLIGGAGDDYMAGGDGNDDYIYTSASGAGTDIIDEYPDEGFDRLDVSSVVLTTFVNLYSTDVQSLGGGQSLQFVTSASVEKVLTGHVPTPSHEGVYTVPGNPGETTFVSFRYGGGETPLTNALYAYEVDADGYPIHTMHGPEDPLFDPVVPFGDLHIDNSGFPIFFDRPYAAGTRLAFFIERSDAIGAGTTRFYSMPTMNPGGNHAHESSTSWGETLFSWEDLSRTELNPLGLEYDGDFDDVILGVGTLTTDNNLAELGFIVIAANVPVVEEDGSTSLSFTFTNLWDFNYLDGLRGPEPYPVETPLAIIFAEKPRRYDYSPVYRPMATAGVDYTGIPGNFGAHVIVIPAGESSVTLTLSVINDNEVEGDETVDFGVWWPDPFGASEPGFEYWEQEYSLPGWAWLYAPEKAFSLIIDDDKVDLDIDSDNSGTIDHSLHEESIEEKAGEPGKYVSVGGAREPMTLGLQAGVTATLSIASGADKVRVWTSQFDGVEILSATTTSISTSEFAARTVWIEAIKPSEADGDIKFTLSAGGVDTDTVQVTARETPLVVSATNAFASETEPLNFGQPLDLGAFTFSRGEGNAGNARLVEFIVSGSAEYGNDKDFIFQGQETFNATTRKGTILIPSGRSSAVLRVIPVNDAISEWDETVTVHILAANGEVITNDSVPATVTILDNDGLGSLLSRNIDWVSTGLIGDRISNGTVSVGLEQGDVQLVLPMAPAGAGPGYRSNDQLRPVASIEIQLPEAVGEFQARLNFASGDLDNDGTPDALAMTFTATGSVSSGGTIRFVVLGDDRMAQYLRTGHYDYDVEITVGSGATQKVRTIRGATEIVNLVNEDFGEAYFGKRWWVDSLDRLIPSDGTLARYADQGLAVRQGMALVRGDNTSAWYTAQPIQASHARIVDRGATNGYFETGLWRDGTSTGGHAGGYRFADRSPVAALRPTANWSLEDLEEGRQYQIFVSYTPGWDRTDQARYTVTGGTRLGSRVASDADNVTIVNQRYTPGEIIVSGVAWRSIGYYTVGAGGVLEIKLENAADSGILVADAVMVVHDWKYEAPDGSFGVLDAGPLDTTGSVYASGFYAGGLQAASTEFTLVDKTGTRHVFDGAGLLVKTIDRNENQSKFAYADGRIESITVQGGLAWTYQYVGNALDTITDFAGRVFEYTVSSGLLTSITSPDPGFGQSVVTASFTYGGPRDQLETVTDGEENLTRIEYDPVFQGANKVKNADTHEWELTPYLFDGLSGAALKYFAPPSGILGQSGDDSQARATYTDARGKAWTYQLDHFGLMTAKSAPGTQSSNNVQNVWKWERDQHGLPTKFTEPAGAGGFEGTLGELVTEYQYSNGNLTRVTYPQTKLGGTQRITESWTYGGQSVVTSHTDGRGNITTYVLDGRGNVKEIQEPLEITTKLEYTDSPTDGDINALSGGLVTKVRDPRGYLTKTEYYTKADGATLSGLLKSVTRGVPDPEEPPTGTVNPDDETVQRFEYDVNRNLSASIQIMGDDDGGEMFDDRRTDFVYDALDRLVTIEEPLVQIVTPSGAIEFAHPTTEYRYDGNGQLVTMTDALGRVTTYTYDAMMRLKRTILPARAVAGTEFEERFYDENGNVIEVRNPRLNSTFYAYDARNLIEKTTLPATDDHGVVETHFRYDTAGNLARMFDSLGINGTPRQTTYKYDSIHRQTSLTLPAPAAAGDYLMELDPPLTETVYDDNDNVVKVAEKNLKTNFDDIFTYDRITETTFDALDRPTLVKRTAPDSSALVTVYGVNEYDNNGNVLRERDALDREIQHEYDGLNRRTNTTFPEVRVYEQGFIGTFSAVTSVKYAYNDASELESQADARDFVTEFGYDALGRTTKITQPAVTGGTPVTLMRYDAVGNLRFSYDPNQSGSEQDWNRTEFEYDEWDQRVKTIGAALNSTSPQFRPVTQVTYDANGNQTSVIDANNNTTSFEYDTHDRISKITQPATADHGAPVTRFQYSAAGNRTHVIQVIATTGTPVSRTMTTVYDNLDRPILVQDPTGRLSETYYLTDGSVAKTIMASGSGAALSTEYTLDNWARTKKTHQGRGAGTYDDTYFTYDLVGNLESITDPAGYETTYGYDALNRRTRETQVGVGSRVYDYDANDNLGRVTTRNARGIEYGYDALNRRVSETWTGYEGNGYEATYTYDLVGNLLTASDSQGYVSTIITSSIETAYDTLNRPRSVTQDATHTPESILVYAYDANGNRTRTDMTVNGHYDVTNAYTFDALNRTTLIRQFDANDPETSTNVHAKAVKFAYGIDGQLKEQQRFENYHADPAAYVLAEIVSKTDFVRDPQNGRLANLVHYGVTGTPEARYLTFLTSYSFTYDANSRIDDFITTEYASGIQTERTVRLDHDYDWMGQVTQVRTYVGTDLTSTKNFDYDTNGNPSGANLGPHNRLLDDGKYTYEYDNEGNRTRREAKTADPLTDRKEIQEYTWDNRNRLVSVQVSYDDGTPGPLVTFEYDVFDRRIVKNVSLGGSTTSSRYVYDGDHVALLAIGGDEIDRRYLWAPGADQLLADERVQANAPAGTPPTVLWNLADHQGTVRDIYRQMDTGDYQIVQEVSYDAFGKPKYNVFDVRFAYAGQEYDEETGLQYSRARYYDPEATIFVSQDPIGFAGGDTNLYRRVGNSPINATDPSGNAIFLAPLVYAGLTSLTAGYVYTQAAYATVETTAEVGLTSAMGGEVTVVGTLGKFLTNFGINLATGGIASTGKWVFRATAYAARQGIDIAGTTAYDVAMGQDFANSLAWNTIGSVGGEAAGTLLGAGAKAFNRNFEFYRLPGSRGAFADSGGLSKFTEWGIKRRLPDVDAPVGPTLPNTTRGWRVGQPINNLTSAGNVPSWTAVRQRFWKNEAHFNAGNYNADILARMQRGLAPQRVNPRTGQLESMELHHTPPQRDGGLFDVRPVWPDDHALIDPFRRTGN